MSVLMERMCRTCMIAKGNGNNRSREQEMTSLTSPMGDKRIIDILRESIPMLKLDLHIKLPKIICCECREKLKEWCEFQRRCLRVEHHLKELLEAPRKSDDDSDSLLAIFESDSRDEDDTLLKAKMEGNYVFEEEFIDQEIDSDDDLLDVDDSEDDLIESCCSDTSIDFILDEESDMEERMPSVSNNVNSQKPKTTYKDEYPCSSCKRILKSKLSLKKHLEMHHKKLEVESKYMCHICKRVFSQAYMLRDHLRSHSGEKPFLCSVCGKGFTTSSSLKQHSFRHQSEKLFSCPDCPKTFPTRTDLASHADIHKARPKSHICDECGRGFPKPFLLKKHKMYHTNERRFSCEFCGKRFFTNEKLQRHTRIHTGEKPYKCKYCEKAYCQSNELTKHLRCHLGENIYQCQLCPQRFSTAKLVKEHFSRHKNDDKETRERNLAAFHAAEIKGIFCR